jgi:hypothetical protein
LPFRYYRYYRFCTWNLMRCLFTVCKQHRVCAIH